MAALRPELRAARLHKPLAMLLFGMINWTFTWLQGRRRARATRRSAPVVADLFLGGLPAVTAPASSANRRQTVPVAPAAGATAPACAPNANRRAGRRATPRTAPTPGT